MKKTIIFSLLLSSLASYAQVSPLAGHQSTILSPSEAKDVWNTMRTDFESGSECFNRAQTWTYDVHKKYGHEAKKILIHYSYKYNKELSSKWGFHIAPLYNVKGEDIVFDKGFQPWLHAPLSPKMWEEKFLAAGTEKLVEKRIKLKEKVLKTKQSIRDMDKSSEFYFDELKRKQEKLKEYQKDLKDFKVTDNDLKKQKPKKIAQIKRWLKYLEEEMKKFRRRSQTYKSIKLQYHSLNKLLRKVQTDLNYAAYIECKKIDSIEELDYNQNEAWCYIQEVSQYYWGVPQLRLLNYGPDHGMNSLPMSYELPEKRRIGAQYAHENDFDMNDVWTARKQAFGNNYKEIWSTEYELIEKSADAVKDIDNIIRKIYRLVDDANDSYEDTIDHSENRKEVQSYIKRVSKLKQDVINAYHETLSLQERIYEQAQDVSVMATKSKAEMFERAQKLLDESDGDVIKMEAYEDIVKEKVKEIERRERRQERERRRRERRRNRN